MQPENSTTKDNAITREELAHMGGGHIAYIRELTSDEAASLFPALKPQIEGKAVVQTFFALFEANGNPIVLSDDVEIVHEKAEDAQLATVTVH